VPVLTYGDMQHLFSACGYWAVGALVALEGLAIPVPGETVLLLAAVYAGTTHEVNVGLVIAAAVCGSILGDNTGYWLGRTLGYRLLLKRGPVIGLNEARLKLGQYLFQRHGGKVVFFGPFVGVLRLLAALLAGVNRLAWPRFVVANAAGGLLWATTVGTAGYVLGHEAHRLAGLFGIAALVLGVTLLVVGGILLHRHAAELTAAAERALPGPLTGLRRGA
jgi:membrane protein DedA with SNARE-associated domain